MKNFFRVITAQDLQIAEATGLVPTCPSDKRDNCIHLNFQEDVEAVATAYFMPEEYPVAIEIRHSDIASRLTFPKAKADKPWQQVLLHQPNILFCTVVAVRDLDWVPTRHGHQFTLRARA